jgi:hypothetical protein
MSYTLIERKELTGSASSIEFTSIPQIFTDLILLGSLRGSASSNFSGTLIKLNAVTPVGRRIEGNGSSAYSQTFPTFGIPANTSTANTFNNFQAYLPSYTSSSNKTISIETTTENNATESYQNIVAGVYTLSAGVTTILISSDSGSFVAGSSISLYGINRNQAIGKPKAIGGAITFANGYWVHTFNSSGTFSTLENLDCEYLVVGSGSGGASVRGGGGGAGGVLTGSLLLSSKESYSIALGAGGLGGPTSGSSQQQQGTPGIATSAFGFSALGGGLGGRGGALATTGGSGGGGGGRDTSPAEPGASGISGQGNAGGTGGVSSSTAGGGGGGGAGSAGSNGGNRVGGNGGLGLKFSITGSVIGYAGGGGGGVDLRTGTGIGGQGFDGGGSASNLGGLGGSGAANTGGGGASGGIANGTIVHPGGNGGSGVVIVRYKA